MQGSEKVLEWFWLFTVLAVGGCVGSFLNVVIYRLPRGRSLVSPGSACPSCGEPIQFYDNIPMLSWLLLWGRCRYCKERISFRYFAIEFLTAMLFVGVYVLYFMVGYRSGIGSFMGGGWFVYLLHMMLLSTFVAASAIDLELWVIPLSVCWFATAAGIIASTFGVFVILPAQVHGYDLLPNASVSSGAMAAGGGVGLIVSLLLLWCGVIKRSYPEQEGDSSQNFGEPVYQPGFNHRREVIKEVVFLLPVILGAVGTYRLTRDVEGIRTWWVDFSQLPAVSGFLGSLWGYFVGCGVVWATRILGTLGFGKEAMGLGDVHLMGAAGAVIGPVFVFLSFFIAPFYGLAWAGYQTIFKKTRQIPYGPFLSLAVFTVMIFHDGILRYLTFLRYH